MGRDAVAGPAWVQVLSATCAPPHATTGDLMPTTTDLPKLAYSTREVATMLGVSRPTIDRLVADGYLPAIWLGPTRRTLIPTWAVDDLAARPAECLTPRRAMCATGVRAGTNGPYS